MVAPSRRESAGGRWIGSNGVLPGLDRQRIDKWLWHARVVRTRSNAAALVEAGHARINGNRVRAPGHALRAGDVVTLALDRTVRVLEVVDFCDRRGGAGDAAATYRDLTPKAASG